MFTSDNTLSFSIYHEINMLTCTWRTFIYKQNIYVIIPVIYNVLIIRLI